MDSWNFWRSLDPSYRLYDEDWYDCMDSWGSWGPLDPSYSLYDEARYDWMDSWGSRGSWDPSDPFDDDWEARMDSWDSWGPWDLPEPQSVPYKAPIFWDSRMSTLPIFDYDNGPRMPKMIERSVSYQAPTFWDPMMFKLPTNFDYDVGPLPSTYLGDYDV